MKKIILGFLVLSGIFFASCGKEDHSLIPEVLVNVSIPANDPRINGITTPGTMLIFDNYGYAGLILYCNASKVILAFDRCSTVNPELKTKLVQIGSSSLVEDKVSGAIFNLEDGGSPSKAPAVHALKRYSVSNNGSIITIFN